MQKHAFTFAEREEINQRVEVAKGIADLLAACDKEKVMSETISDIGYFLYETFASVEECFTAKTRMVEMEAS